MTERKSFQATDRREPSMGPRSDNRGYVKTSVAPLRFMNLQWVHGQIAVVMTKTVHRLLGMGYLQWVHGQITVVMDNVRQTPARYRCPSMGPRSDNRGYACNRCDLGKAPVCLQWVHGQINVVMPA